MPAAARPRTRRPRRACAGLRSRARGVPGERRRPAASNTPATVGAGRGQPRGDRRAGTARSPRRRPAARQHEPALEQRLRAARGEHAGQGPAGERQLPVVARRWRAARRRRGPSAGSSLLGPEQRVHGEPVVGVRFDGPHVVPAGGRRGPRRCARARPSRSRSQVRQCVVQGLRGGAAPRPRRAAGRTGRRPRAPASTSDDAQPGAGRGDGGGEPGRSGADDGEVEAGVRSDGSRHGRSRPGCVIGVARPRRAPGRPAGSGGR